MPFEAEKWSNLQKLAASIVHDDEGASARSWLRFWTQLQPILENWVRSPGFLGRVSARDDYCRDIVLLTWEKLQDNDYNKLRAFFRRRSPPGDSIDSSADAEATARAFSSWLFRVFKNIGIDYMRQLPEYVRRPKGLESGSNGHASSGSDNESDVYWRAVVTLHTQEKPVFRTFTSSATAQQLLEFLDTSIPARQSTAARLYREGNSYQRIAEEIGLADEQDAKRVVRRSLDRLKYRRALEMWTHNYNNDEIARELELDGPQHAHRIINAAKEFLKRRFRT